MATLFRGFLIGLSIAAPVGPIGVLCIRRTLAYGRLSGLITGLGAATADALFGSIAALGLTALSALLVEQQMILRLTGGVFLLYLGIRTSLEKPKPALQTAFKRGELDQEPAAVSPAEHRLVADYFSTFLLTLTNPMTIISFAAIFAGLGIAEASEPVQAFSLVTGVFLGSAAWWLLLSSLANAFRARFLTPNGLRLVNLVSGIIISGFGLAAIASVVIKW
jgi:threonine/homoserine/homoserine lactone efflux protein